jgi:TPR repeat protein
LHEVPQLDGRVRKGEADMARFEINDIEAAAFGESPAESNKYFELGMMYSSGRSVPIDYVSAHKWFNLAAMQGNADAIRLRREIAAEMTEAEIAAAQRAARDWMKISERPEVSAAA